MARSLGRATALAGAVIAGALAGACAPSGTGASRAGGTDLFGNAPRAAPVSAIDASLEPGDRPRAAAAEAEAALFGSPAEWRGAARGRVEPGPIIEDEDGECRDLRHTATIKGKEVSAAGRACRGADGAWTPARPLSPDAPAARL